MGASRLRRNKYLIVFTRASVLLALPSPKQFAFAEHISVLSVFSLPPVCWTIRQLTAHFYLSLKQLSFLKRLTAPGPAGMKEPLCIPRVSGLHVISLVGW